MLSDDVADSKFVENVHVPFKTASIIEDITIGFVTPIFDEASDSTSDDVNEIVESKIPALPSKSIEFSCAEYNFMVIPIEHILVNHLSPCHDPTDGL